jgi:hypothetical protein
MEAHAWNVADRAQPEDCLEAGACSRGTAAAGHGDPLAWHRGTLDSIVAIRQQSAVYITQAVAAAQGRRLECTVFPRL